MKAWEVEEIRRAVKGKWLMRAQGRAAISMGSVSTDSRKVGAGDLFVAINGERFDAHDYLREVMEKRGGGGAGASGAFGGGVGTGAGEGCLGDSGGGYGRGAESARGGVSQVDAGQGDRGRRKQREDDDEANHSCALVGEGGGHVSPKSFNNNIGMPLTLLEVSPSHEYVVLEIGTNAPGEIAALGEVARPDIAVITSIGLEHLEKLGDLEGVAKEEAAIAPLVVEGGTLVLPADAPELIDAARSARVQRILVGRGPGMSTGIEERGSQLDFMLSDVVEGMDGTAFSINGRGAFKVPLLGEHNAMNALDGDRGGAADGGFG